MKKKLLITLTALMLLILTLVSCGSSSGDKSPDNSGNEPPKKEELSPNQIFTKTSELYLIADPTLDETALAEIASGYDYARETIINYAGVDSEAHAHEIVLGNTERQISRDAIAKIDRVEKNHNDELVYLVYSDGSSIALVWEEDEDGAMEELALEHFLENYVTGELTARTGIVSSASIDLYEYYKEIDAEYKAEAWAKFEAKYGKELADAYKQLYAIYSADCITWLANLYDPDICVCVDLYGLEECEKTKYCGTGAFYYSNSARDTMGYLPDVESTNQALGFLNSAGLAYRRTGGWLSIVTEEMKEQIGAFVYNLEEPNGYFYHPQWGIELTDSKISRRARDLSWSTSILSSLKIKPKYTTASGVGGEDITPSSSRLDTRLGESRVAAVSKVIAASDEIYADQLKSLDAFKAYLARLDLRNKSYPVGNELTAQVPQIQAADKKLGTVDDPTPLMDYLIEWLNEGQNPETGNWDWKKPGDVGYANYYGTNGLLKISGIYSKHKVTIPHAREAALSAMADIINPAQIGAVVDLYNTWFAIQNVLENLRAYGGEEGDLEAEAIITELRRIAPEAVLVSRDKIKDFLKPDGSASYGRLYSSPTSQGVPAAVPNSVEGDVNGSTIAINGIIGHSTSALGITKIPLFGEAERYLFRKTVRELSPLVKDTSVLTTDPFDFEYDTIGEESADLSIEHYGGNGTAFVIADPTNSNMGNVTEIRSYSGVGDSIRVPNPFPSSVDTTYVFEGDFYFESCSTSYPLQVTLGSCYMIAFKTNEEGKIELWEESSASKKSSMSEYLGATVEMKEWFNLRVEYYSGDHDSVRIKVYLDTNIFDEEGGKLLAVSDNYYDNTGIKIIKGTGTPGTTFKDTNIYAMSPDELTLYIDNVASYKTRLAYTEVSDPNKQPYFNADAPDKDRVVYDFADGKIGEDIKVTDSQNSFSVGADNSLTVVGADASSSITVPMTVRTRGARCGVATFDLNVTAANAGDTLATVYGMDGASKMFGVNILSKSDGGDAYITLQPTGKTAGAVLSDTVKIPLGTKATVSLEYYHPEDTLIVRVNGEFVGASILIYTEAERFTMDSIVIETKAKKSFELSLDNIVVERTTDLFVEAVAPKIPSKVHGFDTDDKDVILSGTGTSYQTRDNNRVVELGSSKTAKNSLKIPVNNRSDVSNSAILELTLNYPRAATSDVANYIDLCDKDGNVIASFALVFNSTNVELYEVGVSGILSYPVYSYKGSSAINLKFEIFNDFRMIHIYDGSAVVAKSSVFVGEEYIDNGYASVTIRNGSANSTVAIDDVRFETVYTVYTNVNVPARDNPEKKISEGLTFEYSNTGNIPLPVVSKMSGATAFVSIRHLYNTYRKNYSNVFSFYTDTGSNDNISFRTSDSMGAYTQVAFETDIMLDLKSEEHAYQIFFSAKERKGYAYMLQFRKSGNTIVLTDNSNTSNKDGNTATLASNLKNGEWFNLRVEYYKSAVANDIRIKIYINGSLAAISDNYYGSENAAKTPATLIEEVCFYSFGATQGTLYFDNVSLTGSNATCNEDVTVSKK